LGAELTRKIIPDPIKRPITAIAFQLKINLVVFI